MKRGPACVADGQGNERRLVKEGNCGAANRQRAAGAGDAGFVFQTGALDFIVGAAILHEQIGFDLVAVAEGIGDADGAKAIEGEGLIREE